MQPGGLLPPASAVDAAPGLDLASILRTRVFELFVVVWSLPFGLAILSYFQIRRRPAEVRAVLRLWSAGFLWGARRVLGLRYRIEGLGHLAGAPVILACNHQSYWESIALTALVPDINVISKRGAMAIPIFGWGLRHAPMTPVDRDAPGRNIRRILREGRQSLAAGRSVLIFPEGTRVAPGGRRRHERGIECLYRHCGAAIVPVVTDAGAVWPAGFGTKRPGQITLRFLAPIAPGQDSAAVAWRLERLLNEEKDRLPGVAGG